MAQLNVPTAKAILRNTKSSQQKAGLVMELIRNKPVETALADLQFSKKRLSEDARKLLLSAIANAENNHQLNVDDLIVKEAYADKAMVMKRFRARARGRAGKILKPRCHMTIVVAEKEAMEKAKAKTAKKADAKAEAKPAKKAAPKKTESKTATKEKKES